MCSFFVFLLLSRPLFNNLLLCYALLLLFLLLTCVILSLPHATPPAIALHPALPTPTPPLWPSSPPWRPETTCPLCISMLFPEALYFYVSSPALLRHRLAAHSAIVFKFICHAPHCSYDYMYFYLARSPGPPHPVVLDVFLFSPSRVPPPLSILSFGEYLDPFLVSTGAAIPFLLDFFHPPAKCLYPLWM